MRHPIYLRLTQATCLNFAYSAFAWIRIGTSGSAFLQSAKKSW